MTDPKESYRKRHAQACKKAFDGFHPDLTGCKKPELVLRMIDLAASGLFSAEIAQILCLTPKAVQKTYRRYNFPVLHNLTVPLGQERGDWIHGQKIAKGYLYQRTPDHPHGSKHGSYVAVHRLVMEEKLGRFLLPTEVVDHIDGYTMNNHPDNLRVFPSNAEHLAETLRGKRPKWSEAGKLRISEAVRKRHLMARALKEASIRQE